MMAKGGKGQGARARGARGARDAAAGIGASSTAMTQGAVICMAVAVGYALAIAVHMAGSPAAGDSCASLHRLLRARGATLGRPPTADETQWLANEGARRAAEYIQAAERVSTGSFREREKEIAQNGELTGVGTARRRHQALVVVQQVLGALDLSPTQPNMLDAAKLLLAACDMEPEYAGGGQFPMIEHAVALAAAACRKQGGSKAEARGRLQALVKWIDDPAQGVLLRQQPAPNKEVRKEFGKSVRGWLRRPSPPHLPASYLFSNTSNAGARSSSDSTRKAITASLKDHVLFPTHIMTINVIEMMPAGFCERLAKLAREKYKNFVKTQHTSFIKEAPPDMELTTSILNDNFFMEQTKSSGDLDTPEGRAWWPDMYRKSKDFKLLRKVIHAAMLEYAGRHGLVTPPEPWQPAAHPDMYDISLWAAVYPDDSVFPGARIGHHNHPGSLVSCVIYVQTSGQPTPIAFVDPRGVDSTRDWHSVWQNKEESDYDAHTQRESSDLSII